MKVLTRREAVLGILATTAACATIPRYAIQSLPITVPLTAFDTTDRLVLEHPSLAYSILLTRIDETFVAVSMECTHRGCPLTARRDDLSCSCHGSEFTATGEVLKGPAEVALRRYPTRQEGDAVIVTL